MNNPHQRPVSNPRKFISAVFDLAYGARDGSEPLGSAEIKANLKEAGIDADAAWKDFTKLLHASPKTESLSEVRRRRLAAAPPIAAPGPATRKPRLALLEEISALVKSLGSQHAGLFARKWEEASDDDLAAIRDQLLRQQERSREDEQPRH
jgi:hypothetical protein